MLEKFNCDCLLLEAHQDIDAPTAPAIGLMLNGPFTMDRLGCYVAIRAAAQDGELGDSHFRDSNRKSLISLKHMTYHEEKTVSFKHTARPHSSSPLRLKLVTLQARLYALLQPTVVPEGAVRPAEA